MRTLFLSLIFVLALVPAPTHAQSFGQIFPVACKCDNVQIDNGAGTSPSAPAYGCVLQTLQNVIRIAFSLAFVLVTLALIYAGFVWMTSAGNPGKVEQGKHLLLNTLLGLFIMLGAWLIIDFVMKSIYNDSAQDSFGPWNDILADNTPGSECLIARNPTAFTSGTIAVGTAVATGATAGSQLGQAGGEAIGAPQASNSLTHAQAASLLQAAGIAVSSSGNCSNKDQASCTSFDGIHENTVKQAVAVKQACNCNVTVTGGTEVGHANVTLGHGNGYKIDLRITNELSAYIESLTRSGARSNGDPIYRDRCGNEYVHEGSPPHWDITVSSGVCSPPK